MRLGRARLGNAVATRELLLRACLAPMAEARQAWSIVASQVDLDGTDVPDADLLPLLAHRLDVLDPDHGERPRIMGALRRSWYAAQLALSRISEELPPSTASGPPLLTGRLATTVAYLPLVGLVPLGTTGEVFPSAPPDRPTMAADLMGRPVVVPPPDVHLLDMVAQGWWVDAAFAANHPTLDWSRAVVQARRDRRRATVSAGMARLDTIIGPGRIPIEVLAELDVGPMASAAELAWRAARRGHVGRR